MVALYIRLSKEDKTKKESESITNQRLLLTNFAKSHNLKIFQEYVDDGISGTTFNRPAFNRLLKDIEKRRINMVLTKDMSRLGRDYILTGHYIEKYFPENHVRYISILDEIDTGIDSISNDLTPFRSILNDMYAKDISNKIKSVKHAKQDLGLFIGSKAIYGYVLNKNFPGKLFVDKNVSSIIYDIFESYKKGICSSDIAKNLNKNHILTPSLYAISQGYKIKKSSNIWTSSMVNNILKNEVYIGNMIQGKMKKINYKSKKNIRLPKDNWKIVKNTHEAIIDKETFEIVSKMLNMRKKTRVKNYDYLLKGIVFCKNCKKKMGATKTKQDYFYFRCNSVLANSQNKCKLKYIRMDYIENIIKNSLKDIVNSVNINKKLEELTKLKISENLSLNENLLKIKKYEEYISKIDFSISLLYTDRLNNIITLEDFKKIYNEKLKEKSKIKNEINTIKNVLTLEKKDMNKLSKNLIDKFYSNIDINKETLYKLVNKIEIDDKNKIYIYLNFNI